MRRARDGAPRLDVDLRTGGNVLRLPSGSGTRRADRDAALRAARPVLDMELHGGRQAFRRMDHAACEAMVVAYGSELAAASRRGTWAERELAECERQLETEGRAARLHHAAQRDVCADLTRVSSELARAMALQASSGSTRKVADLLCSCQTAVVGAIGRWAAESEPRPEPEVAEQRRVHLLAEELCAGSERASLLDAIAEVSPPRRRRGSLDDDAALHWRVAQLKAELAEEAAVAGALLAERDEARRQRDAAERLAAAAGRPARSPSRAARLAGLEAQLTALEARLDPLLGVKASRGAVTLQAECIRLRQHVEALSPSPSPSPARRPWSPSPERGSASASDSARASRDAELEARPSRSPSSRGGREPFHRSRSRSSSH